MKIFQHENRIPRAPASPLPACRRAFEKLHSALRPNKRLYLPEIGWFSSTGDPRRALPSPWRRQPKSTRRVRPGQRIGVRERLFPSPSTFSQDDEYRPISGISPPRKRHPRERCRYPQPRQPQTHPPTKATEGSHCASSRRAPSCSFAPSQQKSAARLISLLFLS